MNKKCSFKPETTQSKKTINDFMEAEEMVVRSVFSEMFDDLCADEPPDPPVPPACSPPAFCSLSELMGCLHGC